MVWSMWCTRAAYSSFSIVKTLEKKLPNTSAFSILLLTTTGLPCSSTLFKSPIPILDFRLLLIYHTIYHTSSQQEVKGQFTSDAVQCGNAQTRSAPQCNAMHTATHSRMRRRAVPCCTPHAWQRNATYVLHTQELNTTSLR